MVVAAAALLSVLSLSRLLAPRLLPFPGGLESRSGDERRDERPQVAEVLRAEPLEAAVRQAVPARGARDRHQRGRGALSERRRPGGAGGRAGAAAATADAPGAGGAGAGPVLPARDRRDGALDEQQLAGFDVPRGEGVAAQGLGVGDAEGEPGARGGEGRQRGRVRLAGGGRGGCGSGSGGGSCRR